MLYEWRLHRYWLKYLKNDLKSIYFKWVHNIQVGFRYGNSLNNSTFPKLGKGQFVSVYSKGSIIQIIDEKGDNDEVRLIPLQYNHGVLVEIWRHGKQIAAYNIDNETFIGFASKNVEYLAKHDQINTNDFTSSVERSDLFKIIHANVNLLKLEKTYGDGYDKNSISVKIEKDVIKYFNTKNI